MSEVQDTQFSTAQQLINTVNQKIENRDDRDWETKILNQSLFLSIKW